MPSQINAVTSQQDTGRLRALQAIKSASERTGVDFSYLLNKAQQESGLNATAKAKTSSASGLFQFIDQTWLRTLKAHGADHGLSDVADQITIGQDGVARVKDQSAQKAILNLRYDPEVASLMAAELAQDNKAVLARQTKQKIGATEMYLAHFLGAQGACKFMCAMKDNPKAAAADLLPAAAAAHKNVFFDKATGEAKTVSEVYARFAQKFDAPAVLPEGGVRYAKQKPDLTQVKLAALNAASHNDLTAAQSMGRGRALSLRETKASSQLVGMGHSGQGVNNISLSPHTSPTFATMLLAQMDAAYFALEARKVS
ncbi:MAG: lytic transglycosylase domain-containing protein [Alphaproteobacteria bacterium]|nr:lytic transglycosylase domain-containing protein [Alphaproteobacteria bacterium]